jgi:DNA-binding response OmpR family regulator
MSRVLIAEDEARIASFLEKGLRANGFATAIAATGEEALLLASLERFELLILDLGLPDRDGMDVLRELRVRGHTLPRHHPHRSDGVRETVSGLEGGADDCVTKPFSFEELLARVRVQPRGDRASEETVLHAGAAALDLRTRRLLGSMRPPCPSAMAFTIASPRPAPSRSPFPPARVAQRPAELALGPHVRGAAGLGRQQHPGLPGEPARVSRSRR